MQYYCVLYRHVCDCIRLCAVHAIKCIGRRMRNSFSSSGNILFVLRVLRAGLFFVSGCEVRFQINCFLLTPPKQIISSFP